MSDPMENLNNAALALSAAASKIDDFIDEAENQVGAVAGRYGSTVAKIYVDQAVGNDAHAGTKEAPVATIQRAVELSVPGVVNQIIVRGNYTTTQRYLAYGRKIGVLAAVGEDWETNLEPAQRPTLTIGHAIIDEDGVDYARLFGFSIGYGAIWNILNFDIVLPSQAVVLAGNPAAQISSSRRALFVMEGSAQEPAGTGVIRYGEVTVPADCFARMLSNNSGGGFFMHSTTLAGSLDGLIHPRATAGTSSDDVNYLHTNLTTL